MVYEFPGLMLASTQQLLTSPENSMAEVRQFCSSARGTCRQRSSAQVTVSERVPFGFCERVCVPVEPFDVFPSAMGTASHGDPAESDGATRVKLRLVLPGISFSTVS